MTLEHDTDTEPVAETEGSPWPRRDSLLGRFLLAHGWTPTDDVDLRTLARIGVNNGVRFQFRFRQSRPLVARGRQRVDHIEVTDA